MIKSFKCADTQRPFETGKSVRFSTIAKAASRKLVQLEAAATLEFLRSPPGNHFEKLVNDREGQHSIRVNDQWRICFEWREGAAFNVEVVDYHKG